MFFQKIKKLFKWKIFLTVFALVSVLSSAIAFSVISSQQITTVKTVDSANLPKDQETAAEA